MEARSGRKLAFNHNSKQYATSDKHAVSTPLLLHTAEVLLWLAALPSSVVFLSY